MASTGFLFQGRCYASHQDAESAHWTQVPGSLAPGNPAYMTDVVWDGSAWVLRTYSVGAGGAVLQSSVPAPTPDFPSCDPYQPFQDGMDVGLGIAAAIIMAYVIRIQGWGTR